MHASALTNEGSSLFDEFSSVTIDRGRSEDGARRRARRHPDVMRTLAAGATRREEDREPIGREHRVVVIVWARELGHCDPSSFTKGSDVEKLFLSMVPSNVGAPNDEVVDVRVAFITLLMKSGPPRCASTRSRA